MVCGVVVVGGVCCAAGYCNVQWEDVMKSGMWAVVYVQVC